MPDAVGFQMLFEAEADVVRVCCGGNHDLGDCPLDTTDTKEG